MEYNNVPKQLELDTAATIFPFIETKKTSSMFRLSITLKEKIDINILKIAVEKVIKRIPSFSYRLKKGFFWYYFSYTDSTPLIEKDCNNPMIKINWEDNKHFVFRIRYHENKIALEIFHALTDGFGGLIFLLTLVGEYLKIKYNYQIKYSNLVLSPQDEPKKEEYEDAYEKVASKLSDFEFDKIASYVFKGTLEENHILNIITGTIPIKNLKEICSKYKCTVTEFLVSVMIYAIQEIKEKDKSFTNRRKSIKITIPVNLRKFYNYNCLRNFSSYVNVGIDCRYGHYDFDEIITSIKNQMKFMLDEKKINAKVSSHVKIKKHILLNITPIFIKRHIFSFGEKLFANRICSTNLSNLGNVEVPEEIAKHVLKMDFIMGRSKAKPVGVSCISINSNLYISFSRRIMEAEFERIFFNFLSNLNLPIEIESNQR